MFNYCKACAGITKHTLHRVSADLITWVCEPCTTIGVTASRESLARHRAKDLYSPEACDELFEKTKAELHTYLHPIKRLR